MLHYLRVTFVIAINVIFFMLTVFPVSLIVSPLRVDKRLKYTSLFWKYFAIVLLKTLNANVLKIDLRDEGTKKINNPPGLYISNHQSLMDIPLLLSVFQNPPIMKKSILYIPFFGICAYATGCVCVDRKSHRSRKEALDKAIFRLHNYHRGLQVYPEGTRNREADSPKDLKRIKKPLVTHAYKNNIPVYSVSICGNKGFFDKDKIINFNKNVGLRITDKIEPKDYKSEEEFIAKCWGEVQGGYKELEGKLNSDTI